MLRLPAAAATEVGLLEANCRCKAAGVLVCQDRRFLSRGLRSCASERIAVVAVGVRASNDPRLRATGALGS